MKRIATAMAVTLVCGVGAGASQALPSTVVFHCGAEREYNIYRITIREPKPTQIPGAAPARESACGHAELVVMNQFRWSKPLSGLVPLYRHWLVIQPGARVASERWYYTWQVYPGPSEIRFVASHRRERVRFAFVFTYPAPGYARSSA